MDQFIMVSVCVLLVLSLLCRASDGFSNSANRTYKGCSGWLSSRNVPLLLNNGTYVEYHIEVPDQHVIRLELVILDMEQSADCSKDQLLIYDGKDVDAPLIASFCGQNNEQVSTFRSSSRRAFVRFHSQVSTGGLSFIMSYMAVLKTGISEICPPTMPPSDGCDEGVKVISRKSGMVASPGYPSPYPNNLHCVYKIDVSEYGSEVSLTFRNISMESDFRCPFDWVKLYNPSSAVVKGPYCALDQLERNIEYTNTAVIYIQFKTDIFITGPGFKLMFIARGNPAIMTTTSNLLTNLSSDITASTPPTQPRLTTITSSTGRTTTRTVTTTQTTKTLPVFEVPELGTVDIKSRREGYIVSPGYPGNYPKQAYGSIEITASSKVGNIEYRFAVEYLDVEVNRKGGCYDYLTLSFDSGDAEFEFCGNNMTDLKPVVVKAKVATVAFKSDYYNSLDGFKLHFSMTDVFDCGRPAVDSCLLTPSHSSQCANAAGTQYALINSHPWQVALTTSAGYVRCDGAVLHPEWVVVAAHCVEFGIEDVVVQSGARSGGGALRNSSIRRTVMHRISDYDYDIALLRLEQALVFDEEVSAICLPGSLNLTGANAVVTTWGSGDEDYAMHTVDRIRESQLTIMPHGDCVTRYGDTLVTDRMLCAASNSEQPFKADPGGLLVVRSPEGSYSLAGIFEMGIIHGRHGDSGMFTNITAVSDWLADVMTWL